MAVREEMKRKDFLKLMISGAGSLALSSMFPSCRSSELRKPGESIPPEPVQSLESALAGDTFANDLMQIISNYSYGQLNLLQYGLDASFNEEAQEMLLYPFYQHDIYPASGSCTELMKTAFKDIKDKYPCQPIIRAHGTDPDFFSDTFADHYFLLLPGKDLMGKADMIDDEKKVNNILKTDPLLVDPSFKKIARFSSSGYSVRELYGEGYDFKFSNALFFTEIDYFMYYSVPLYLTGQNELMLLSPDFGSSSLLSIGFQRRRQEPELFDLRSSALTQRAKADPVAAEMLSKLRKQEIFSTTDNLLREYVMLSL